MTLVPEIMKLLEELRIKEEVKVILEDFSQKMMRLNT
jgi:hypothetical protein